jgi:chaperonin GroES
LWGNDDTKKGDYTMAIKPLADRIVIETLEAEKQTAGGIYIPDNAKEKPQKGKVVAVGTGRVTDSGSTLALMLKVDDVVLYGKYAGTEVSDEGKDLIVLKESDVLAIVE